ncbi:MAG: bifunctional hydroxymethylpyrimidine kinase/phosphomethylpyrimidine kinase [Nitrososphaeraceae archaeon]
MKIKSVLTIAGSDPSSGAGIQADLKTFSLLGVYGCSAITTITLQNTSKISGLFPLPSNLVAGQIKTILDDIKIDSIKIGVVYNKRIIDCIYKILKAKNIPIIVDPIFYSSNQFELLKANSLNYYIDKILPLATIITPNIKEAELLSKRKIKDKKTIIEALNLIKSLGAKNVILKSIRLKREHSIDMLLDHNNTITEFSKPWQLISENHGSGCNFSSAITSFITKGFAIKMACRMANDFLHRSLKNTFHIGSGLPIVEPTFVTYLESFRYEVISDLANAIEKFQEIENVGILVPETQSNFVYAIPEASDIKDIAGVKGRIIKIGKKVRPASCVEFGVSKHVASALLEYMKRKTSIRSAINIKYDIKIVDICKRFLIISEYNRNLEPQKIKENEGSSVRWGVREALSKNKNAKLIYHKGDMGKEPMIILFGNSPHDIITYVKKIISLYA